MATVERPALNHTSEKLPPIEISFGLEYVHPLQKGVFVIINVGKKDEFTAAKVTRENGHESLWYPFKPMGFRSNKKSSDESPW